MKNNRRRSGINPFWKRQGIRFKEITTRFQKRGKGQVFFMNYELLRRKYINAVRSRKINLEKASDMIKSRQDPELRTYFLEFANAKIAYDNALLVHLKKPGQNAEYIQILEKLIEEEQNHLKEVGIA